MTLSKARGSSKQSLGRGIIMVTTVCPCLPNTKIGSELLTAELRTAGGQEQHEYPYLPPSLVPGDCLSLSYFPKSSRITCRSLTDWDINEKSLQIFGSKQFKIQKSWRWNSNAQGAWEVLRQYGSTARTITLDLTFCHRKGKRREKDILKYN